jgi:hypothetical protein
MAKSKLILAAILICNYMLADEMIMTTLMDNSPNEDILKKDNQVKDLNNISLIDKKIEKIIKKSIKKEKELMSKLEKAKEIKESSFPTVLGAYQIKVNGKIKEENTLAIDNSDNIYILNTNNSNIIKKSALDYAIYKTNKSEFKSTMVYKEMKKEDILTNISSKDMENVNDKQLDLSIDDNINIEDTEANNNLNVSKMNNLVEGF